MSVQSSDLAVEFKDIPGFPGYRVGSDGSVWSCLKQFCDKPSDAPQWRKLKPYARASGHLVVTLRANGRPKLLLIHRLVLTAFVGPRPDGMECCHDDGNPWQ